MRKLIYLSFAIISSIMFSCSNDNDNSTSNNEDASLKFEIEGGLKFTSKIPNSDLNLACGYSEYINNNGSKKHTISGLVHRFGDNPLYLQDGILLDVEFTTAGDLEVNQIIQISNLNNFSVFLPYKSTENYNQSSNTCNSLQLQQQSNSTGFVKITQITNQYIYGEFEFNNLKNFGGTNLFNGNTCPNYPTQQNYNIINGKFQALK